MAAFPVKYPKSDQDATFVEDAVAVYNEEEPSNPVEAQKWGNHSDRRDMDRMGKRQTLRVHFPDYPFPRGNVS